MSCLRLQVVSNFGISGKIHAHMQKWAPSWCVSSREPIFSHVCISQKLETTRSLELPQVRCRRTRRFTTSLGKAQSAHQLPGTIFSDIFAGIVAIQPCI